MVTIIKALFPLKLCKFICVSLNTSMRLLTAQMYASLRKGQGSGFPLLCTFVHVVHVKTKCCSSVCSVLGNLSCLAN